MQLRDSKSCAGPGYKVIQRKRQQQERYFGSQYPRTGNIVGLSTIITLLVFGSMVVLFMMALPGCIDELAGHSANVVAMSTGVK